MSDEQDDRDQEERSKRPRPRIIDKRVSSRSEGSSAPAPAPEQETSEPAEVAPPPAPAAPAPDQPQQQSEPPEAPQAGPGEEVWTPEQEAQAQQMAKEIAERPSEDWVLNVAVTLANVAGAKLDMGLAEDAGLAIDAFETLVNGVGSRLEGAEAPLRQTLAQLQMAYAQTIAAPPPAP